MTDKEKAIVMAYTGIAMLTGDKFQIFHKYVEEIMGRPVFTHELATYAEEIKERAKFDFLALCAEEEQKRPLGEWIPCSERLPDKYGVYLVTGENGHVFEYDYSDFTAPNEKWSYCRNEIVAWMPLPKPYEKEGGTNEFN